ncbi:hypothetical protein DK37_29520 [Halomonas sp. SUBG004]|nr:hypothetical protein DK37_29520 [Halomonas sp. SUBG004]
MRFIDRQCDHRAGGQRREYAALGGTRSRAFGVRSHGATASNVFSLDNPSRLVIDLDDSQLNTDASTLPLEGSAISAVRTGVRDEGGLRVVLELTVLSTSSFYASA